VVANQEIGVVLELAARNEAGEIGAQRFDFQPRDIAAQIFSMGADIAQTATGSSLFGVAAPGRLLLAFRLDFVEQPSLGILATTLRMRPSLPVRTNSRASLTMGYPV